MGRYSGVENGWKNTCFFEVIDLVSELFCHGHVMCSWSSKVAPPDFDIVFIQIEAFIQIERLSWMIAEALVSSVSLFKEEHK